ncbi:MAG TPA: hypothetical protein VF840_13220 [Terriglobales bacterium]
MLAAEAGALAFIGIEVGNPCPGALRLPTTKPATTANTPALCRQSREQLRWANRDISTASPFGR